MPSEVLPSSTHNNVQSIGLDLKRKTSWRNHKTIINSLLFSAHAPKAQVHYCGHALSIVRPFTFFTSLQPLNGIWRNLSWSKYRVSFTEFVFFSSPSVNKDGRHGLLLANKCSTSLHPLNGIWRYVTWQEASTQRHFRDDQQRRPPWDLIVGYILISAIVERCLTKLDKKHVLN